MGESWWLQRKQAHTAQVAAANCIECPAPEIRRMVFKMLPRSTVMLRTSETESLLLFREDLLPLGNVQAPAQGHHAGAPFRHAC